MLTPATILTFGIGGLGATEIILIVAVLIFFFGAKKIPDLARGLGKSMSEFKKGQAEGAEDITTRKDSLDDVPPAGLRIGRNCKVSVSANLFPP